MNRTRVLSALLCAAALAGCGEEVTRTIDGPELGSRVKFFNFGINAPQVNFYANNVKLTAIASTTGVEATTGVAYGAVSSGGYYSGIAPGSYTLEGRIAATVDKNLPIATQAATIVNGTSYSYFMSGFYNTTTKVSDGFLVEDPMSETIDFANAYVRFVNTIPNAAAMQLILRRPTPALTDTVGAVIAYKNAGVFEVVVPGVYNLATRYAGGAVDIISRADVSFLAGHIYTVTAFGDITVVSTTATNRPRLDNTANR